MLSSLIRWGWWLPGPLSAKGGVLRYHLAEDGEGVIVTQTASLQVLQNGIGGRVTESYFL